MVMSVHLADVGAGSVPAVLRSKVTAANAPAVRWAATLAGAPLGHRVLPKPAPGRVGLLAAWDDDAALDGFLDSHPLAERLAVGWHVRLEPLRASGHWSALPELSQPRGSAAADEPVAVVTLGRLMLRRAVPFLRTNAPAAGQAVDDPGMVLGTGLARPPRLVSTFSLWRSLDAMRSYAYGGGGPWHQAAAKAQAERTFHHESIFARFRPYAARGEWEGQEPLAELAHVASPAPVVR